MTIFRTFTETELAALRLHGLDTHRPSQLADAFVLGMRHAGPERRKQIAAACGEVFGWRKPTVGASAEGTHLCTCNQYPHAATCGVAAVDGRQS